MNPVPVVLGLYAAILDTKSGRIPNWLAGAMFFLGIVLYPSAIMKTLATSAIVVFAWWKGMMPAGDAKLMISFVPWVVGANFNLATFLSAPFVMFLAYAAFTNRISPRIPSGFLSNVVTRFLAFYGMLLVYDIVKIPWYVVFLGIYIVTDVLNFFAGPFTLYIYFALASMKFVIDSDLIHGLVYAAIGTGVFLALDLFVELFNTWRPASLSDIQEGAVIEGHGTDDGLTREEAEELVAMVNAGKVKLSELKVLDQRPFGAFIFLSYILVLAWRVIS